LAVVATLSVWKAVIVVLIFVKSVVGSFLITCLTTAMIIARIGVTTITVTIETEMTIGLTMFVNMSITALFLGGVSTLTMLILTTILTIIVANILNIHMTMMIITTLIGAIASVVVLVLVLAQAT